jgi:imidazole glycerol phosphate synthase glutamine amidotransferase subunit
MIAIFDYGAGNLRSVQNTLREIGAEHTVVDDAVELSRAEKIILPGVGHFGQIMRSLDAMGVREVFIEKIRAGTPFLGICLGLHALFAGSEEAPDLAGFGLFDEIVVRFPRDARVPHMGWNVLNPKKKCRLLKDVQKRPYVYFAHSYYVPVMSATGAECDYTGPYTALLEHENVFGVQFHPEKSGPLGLQIMKNFVEL